jgi:hypothetical protein
MNFVVITAILGFIMISEMIILMCLMLLQIGGF